jgi:hypothetical protein
MSLMVSEPKGGEYVLPPTGSHLARCYRVIDLGTQKTTWNGVEKAAKKCMIVWELHGENEKGEPLITDDGRPLAVSRRFTPSLSEKAALKAFLVAWRGREFTKEEKEGFHLKNILDKWCMINITHDTGNNDKTYANVSSVSPVPVAIKKAGLPDGINPLVWFDIDEPDMEVFDAFPDYLKKIISETPEWKMREIGAADKVEDDDSIPF